jgi:SAM-dependent methyltransferase
VAATATSLAIDRAITRLDPARRPASGQQRDGYLDLLGDEDATGPHPGQRWMASRTLPLIYERAWRPLGGLLLLGPKGPGGGGEQSIASQALALQESEWVLDVGCGPGNFTRSFAGRAKHATVVGLDTSRTMLARAVSETSAPNVAYIRADACALPFRDATFDAICCFAALYLIEDPMRAVDEIARVLSSGGRLVLLSSCSRGLLSPGVGARLTKVLTGVRMFARDELTGALAAHGLIDIEQRVSGLGQLVGARKPSAVHEPSSSHEASRSVRR